MLLWKKFYEKNIISLIKIATTCLLAVFMSCTPSSSIVGDSSKPTQEQPPIATQKAKYTIMLYGAGGGNLDKVLLDNLNEELKFFSNTENVNMYCTAQFNMSSYDDNVLLSYQNAENSPYKGTMRWFMSETGWDTSNNTKEIQILHNPDLLTDFIKWSTYNFPAEKYILILANHGSPFGLVDQPVDSEVTKVNIWNKGVIFDRNNGNEQTPLSIFGIEEGIKNSAIKMELIYFDCCLMGQI